MNRLLFSLHLFITLLFTFSCERTTAHRFKYEADAAIGQLVRQNTPLYPNTTFAVIADVHYFPLSLWAEGSALDEDLLTDRKMLKKSVEIFDATIEALGEEKLDFVLLCGDLTKDGEHENHEQLAGNLGLLAGNGTAVYVVPGNHDIANGHSYKYDGGSKARVKTITADDFMDIYADFGFAAAHGKDPHSLTYIVEPVDGLWVFAMDSCRYRENRTDDEPVTGGMFYLETLYWIEDKLIEAMQKQKAVIGVMHHGILEHYKANAKYYGDYIVDDFETISKMFAAYGMRFVFTGHFHAQDITLKKWDRGISNHFICDIETGSLVTYPAPWRHVAIDNQIMKITSHQITSITSHPDDFLNYAENDVKEKTILLANRTLADFGVPKNDREKLSPQIASAYISHLQGDERGREQALDFTGVTMQGIVVAMVQGDLIEGWYNDLEPRDNFTTIDTITGVYRTH